MLYQRTLTMKNFILFLLLISPSVFAQQIDVRKLAPFDKIQFEGWGNVFLIPGQEEVVEIESKDDLPVTEVRTEVRGNTLYIQYRKNDEEIWKTDPKVNIHITYRTLEAFDAIGVVNLATESPLVAERFRLHMEGTGKKNLEVDVEDLDVTVEGITKMKLSGKAHHQNIVFDGMGKIWAEDLITHTTIAEVNGTGNLYVHATEKLVAEANGFGAKIRYAGNPSQKDIDKAGFVSVRSIH